MWKVASAFAAFASGPLLFLVLLLDPATYPTNKAMPCVAGLFSTCLLYLLWFYCRYFSGCHNCSQLVHRQLLSSLPAHYKPKRRKG